MVYWNWILTRNGAVRFGLLLLLFSFVFQNLALINAKFLSQFPVGDLLLLAIGIFLLRHVYRVLKWYKVWFKYGRKTIWNVIVHLCIYLIVFSVVLSFPLDLKQVSPHSDKAITDRETTKDITSKAVTPEANNVVTSAVVPTATTTSDESKKPQEDRVKSTRGTSRYKTGSKTVNYEYILRGNRGHISYTVYGGLNNHLKILPRTITYYNDMPTDIDFINRDLNNEDQKQLLDPLVTEIQSITSNKDDQARIAISLVQHLDYDWDALKSGNIEGKYPYEVLYTGSGVCSEKTKLLVYLLRGLGYGVSIFRFDENGDFPGHDAIGLACPQQYSYEHTGYCFVETTTPAIITYSSGDYYTSDNSTSFIKLPTNPRLLKISDGNSFNSVAEEYYDAIEYNRLTHEVEILSSKNYDRWRQLVSKYGIQTNN